MKKYLLGSLAFLLAITFSAFTTLKKSETDKVKWTDYYFYKLNSAGTQLETELSSSQISQATAQNLAGCSNNVNAEICGYGFTYRITSLPANVPGDFSVSFKKSN